MSKARGLADLGNVTTRLDEVGNTDGALSNRNLIINGAMQVAQRGTSHSVAAAAFTLDRWYVVSSVTSTVTKEEDTVDGKKVAVIKSSAVGSAYNAVLQRIEGMRRIQGQTYTLSAWVKGTVGTFLQYIEFRDSAGDVVAPLSESLTYTGSWQKFEWTFEAPTNASYDNDAAWFNVSFYGGDSLSLTMVQLELGDTATPFENRSYGQELALCQRYYTRLAGAAAYTRYSSGFNYLSTVNNSIVHLPTPMRALGTLTSSAANTFSIYHSGGSVSICSVISLDTSGGSATVANVNATTSGLTIGAAGLLLGSAVSYLALDAEL
jgi:hypothetical protein